MSYESRVFSCPIVKNDLGFIASYLAAAIEGVLSLVNWMSNVLVEREETLMQAKFQ